MLISKSLVHNGRDEFLKIFSKITDTLKKLVYKFKKEKTKEDPWIDYNLDNTTALLLLLDKFDLHHIYKKQENKFKKNTFKKKQIKQLSEKDLQIYFPLTAQEIKNLSKKLESSEKKTKIIDNTIENNIKNGMILLFGQ